MKKERIFDTIFTIIGIIGFLVFSFLRGLYNGIVISYYKSIRSKSNS